MALSLFVAEEIGELTVSAMLYGLYLPSLFLCARCLLCKGLRFGSLSLAHWLTLLSALTLWLCSTLSLAVGIYRSVQAFVQCVNPNTSITVFMIADWMNVIKV